MLLLLFFLSFLVFAFFFTFYIILLEFSELWVLKTIFHMEGQRHGVKNVLVHSFIIILKIEVKSLFVIHMEVVLNLVVQFDLSELARVIHSIATILLPRLLVLLPCVLLIRILLQFVLFGRLLKGSGHDILRIISTSAYIFDSGFDMWVFTMKYIHDRSLLDLSPTKVCCLQLFFVMFHPPEAVLEKRSYHD